MLDVTMFIPSPDDDRVHYRIETVSCVECGADMPTWEARHTQRMCSVCRQRAYNARTMTRERYREIWQRVRQNRNAVYKTPATFYPLEERNIYTEMVAARAWRDTNAYAKSFKAHVTLTTLASMRKQIESGAIVGGGVNGWKIEIVGKEIKQWRAA